MKTKKVRGVIVEKMIKELNIDYDKSLEDVSKFLDDLDFRKVKTKYTKGDVPLLLYLFMVMVPETEDILKPNVLKSSVKIDTKLQYTKISDEP